MRLLKTLKKVFFRGMLLRPRPGQVQPLGRDQEGFIRRSLSGEAGQAVVEFALIAGIFFLCIFASIQFLFGYYQKHAFYLAAKRGVEVIVTTTKTDPARIKEDVLEAVADILSRHGFRKMAAEIKLSGTEKETGNLAVITFRLEDPGSPATVKIVGKSIISITNDPESPLHLDGITAQASTFQNQFG